MGEQVLDRVDVVGPRGDGLLGLTLQRLEDLVQAGRLDVADPPAEDVGVQRPEDCGRPVIVDQPLPAVLEEAQQVGVGDVGLEGTDVPEGAVNLRAAGRRVDAVAVVPGVHEHVRQQAVRVDAQLAGLAVVVALPGEDPECRVDLLYRRGLALDGGQVEADEVAHLVVGVELDGVPEAVVVLLLAPLVEVHEDEVPDLVRLGQVEAGRVQALEDELGVVRGVQGDVDDAQRLDGPHEVLDAHVHRLHASKEVEVVLGDVGLHDEGGPGLGGVPLAADVGQHRLEGRAVALD